MNFTYGGVWNDAVAMLRANASLLLALAGAFLFLPALLLAYLLPPPPLPEGPPDLDQMLAQMMEFARVNWHWSFLVNLANILGSVAIYMLLLEPGGRTVGGVLAGAARYIPSYFVLSTLILISAGMGFFLLIVPGIYLLGRLAPAGPIMVAEHQMNPLTVIGRAFAMTRRKGWTIAGLLVLVAVGGFILINAVQSVLGSVFLLLGGGPDGIAGLLVAILGAALSAAFSTVMIALLAAIYRALRVD